MTLDEIVKDEDFLRAAFDADDAVSLCEHVSRRHGYELTLEQAGELMDRVQEICESCLGEDYDDEGHCIPCNEPGSGSR